MLLTLSRMVCAILDKHFLTDREPRVSPLRKSERYADAVLAIERQQVERQKSLPATPKINIVVTVGRIRLQSFLEHC